MEGSLSFISAMLDSTATYNECTEAVTPAPPRDGREPRGNIALPPILPSFALALAKKEEAKKEEAKEAPWKVQWTGVAHLTDAGDCFASEVCASEPTTVAAAAADVKMSLPAPIRVSVVAPPLTTSQSPMQPRVWEGLSNESTDLASLNFMPSPSPPRRRRPSQDNPSDASGSDAPCEASMDADGAICFTQTVPKSAARVSTSTDTLLQPVPWHGLAVRSSASDVFCKPSPSPPSRRRRAQSTPTFSDQALVASSPTVTKTDKENVDKENVDSESFMQIDFGSDGYHVLSPLSTLSIHAR